MNFTRLIWISAIFQCGGRFQSSARRTAPPQPLLRKLFAGNATDYSTCPGTGAQWHSWLFKMVLGPLENSHISCRSLFLLKKADRVSRTVVESNHEGPKGSVSAKKPYFPFWGFYLLADAEFFTVVHSSGLLASHVILYFGIGEMC